MSYSKQVLATRDKLLQLFYSYLSVARGIEDLDSEGDIGDLESSIDSILEDNVAKFK